MKKQRLLSIILCIIMMSSLFMETAVSAKATQIDTSEAIIETVDEEVTETTVVETGKTDVSEAGLSEADASESATPEVLEEDETQKLPAEETPINGENSKDEADEVLSKDDKIENPKKTEILSESNIEEDGSEESLEDSEVELEAITYPVTDITGITWDDFTLDCDDYPGCTTFKVAIVAADSEAKINKLKATDYYNLDSLGSDYEVVYTTEWAKDSFGPIDLEHDIVNHVYPNDLSYNDFYFSGWVVGIKNTLETVYASKPTLIHKTAGTRPFPVKERLRQPGNAYPIGSAVYWNEVPDAEYYFVTLEINGEHITETTRYNLNYTFGNRTIAPNSDVTIRIVAVDSNHLFAPSKATVVSFKYNADAANIYDVSFDKTTQSISFSKVDNVDYYVCTLHSYENNVEGYVPAKALIYQPTGSSIDVVTFRLSDFKIDGDLSGTPYEIEKGVPYIVKIYGKKIDQDEPITNVAVSPIIYNGFRINASSSDRGSLDISPAEPAYNYGDVVTIKVKPSYITGWDLGILDVYGDTEVNKIDNYTYELRNSYGTIDVTPYYQTMKIEVASDDLYDGFLTLGKIPTSISFKLKDNRFLFDPEILSVTCRGERVPVGASALAGLTYEYDLILRRRTSEAEADYDITEGIILPDNVEGYIYRDAMDKYNFHVKLKIKCANSDKKKVTFDVSGDAYSEVWVDSGDSVSAPQRKPIVVGKTFEGWFTDSTLTTPFDFSKPIMTDTVIYAKMTDMSLPEAIIVKVNYNGIGGSNYTKPTVYGSTFSEPTVSYPINYRFGGWYLDQLFSVKYDFSSPVTEDITLYAKWIYAVSECPSHYTDDPKLIKQVSPTCTQSGTKAYYVCAKCLKDKHFVAGLSLEVGDPVERDSDLVIPSLGHDFGEYVSNNDETCYAYGTETARCKRAGCRKELTRPSKIKKEHEASLVLKSDVTGHWYTCKNCNDGKADFSAHVDNDKNFLCDVCEHRMAGDNGMWVDGLSDTVYYYTGKPITPEVEVFVGEKLLTRGKDYTVTYKNNINAASKDAVKAPSIIVTGKGNYKGTATATFEIKPFDLATVAIDDIYVGWTDRNIKISPIVRANGKTLTLGRDYSLLDIYENPIATVKDADNYVIKVKPLNNNYTATSYPTFGVHVTSDKLLNKATISRVPDQNYANGAEIKPNVTVKIGSLTLVEGTDYTINYNNTNKEVGIATGTILPLPGRGISGFKTFTFKIKGFKPISKVTINPIADIVYDEGDSYTGGCEPALTVLDGVKPLTRDVDYSVIYTNNKKAGVATAKITGINSYTGSKSITFKIVPYDAEANLASKIVIANKDSIEEAYVKGGTKPEPIITFNGVALKNKADYTVTYYKSDSIAARDQGDLAPNMTINFKGNYKGVLKNINYTITAKNLELLLKNVAVPDVVYSTKAGAWKSKNISVSDLNGKKLSLNTDYRIAGYYREWACVNEFTDSNARAGASVYVKIVGGSNGKYNGSAIVAYRISTANINTVKATVPGKMEYTGNPVTLTGKDIKVTNGYYILKEGVDYEIVRDSYVNNVNKGKAKVTIKGKGNYGGTKVVSFTISPKTFDWWEKLIH